MQDLKGVDIQVGDRVAFATRVGDHAVIKVGTVDFLKPGQHERDHRLGVLVDGQGRTSTINLHGSYHGPKVVVL